eukprot:TRINITY_DN5485_c0_g1_i1.p1 TRINITY_DN5485_c0_g1~~TRINITY_DN5485_c0_g1_i1.p1  ORF type:complete len:538 (+),score=24.85 TRINITY_DN5485_c0_g1_i1:516-2129(+)
MTSTYDQYTLNYSGRNLDNELFDKLSKNTSVQTLFLSCCSIGSNEVGVLSRVLPHTTLQVLHLPENRLGQEGTKILCDTFTQLTELNLRKNCIGDQGAHHLSSYLKSNKLRSLYLADNGIGDSGIKILSKALEDNTSLKKLDLSGNQIGKYGIFYLSKAIKENTVLSTLSLDGIKICDLGLQYLIDSLEQNFSITKLTIKHEDSHESSDEFSDEDEATNDSDKISRIYKICKENKRTQKLIASEIQLKDIEITIQDAFKGSYGSVSFGKIGTLEVAVKTIHGYLPSLAEDFKREIKLNLKLKHPNVLQTLGYAKDSGILYLIMRKEQESLKHVVDRLNGQGKAFNIAEILKIMIDVSSGMAYLHQHQIIHRDMNLNNFLVSIDFMVKVADMGLARKVHPDLCHSVYPGSAYFMAPEANSKYGLPSDVYSFGLVVSYILHTNEVSDIMKHYSNINKTRKEVTDQLVAEIKRCEKVYNIILLCLNENPEERPTFRSMLDELQSINTSFKHMSKSNINDIINSWALSYTRPLNYNQYNII